MNLNCNEITETRTEIERHNVHQASGINVLGNFDAEIVDYDNLDGDCKVSDKSLSLELGANSTAVKTWSECQSL